LFVNGCSSWLTTDTCDPLTWLIVVGSDHVQTALNNNNNHNNNNINSNNDNNNTNNKDKLTDFMSL
jgi:hypothetical protein